MAKYDNTGALFKNDKKESDNHPDYKGSATVNGVEFWLSSWINTDKNGQKYMSVKFNKKEQTADDLKKNIDDPFSNMPIDEDIPF